MVPTPSIDGPAIPEPLFYPLHGLLESIRVLKTYEDPLCALLHTLQTTRSAGPEERRELALLMEGLPAATFLQEWHAIRDQLHIPDTPPAPAKAKSSLPAGIPRRRPATR